MIPDPSECRGEARSPTSRSRWDEQVRGDGPWTLGQAAGVNEEINRPHMQATEPQPNATESNRRWTGLSSD
jgi:hypothetical protein